ncbi:MAG: DNA-binding protein Alba [Candidatus Pacearchaeota archaeon]
MAVQTENKTQEVKEKQIEKGVVLVGSKPLMKYVSAVVLQFNTENLKQVTIRSRGKFISKAVDVAEVVRNKFLKDKNLKSKVSIGTENFTDKAGKQLSISTIEIVLEV